ncbi:MAG TPA: glycoside hydrolase family 44 protein [Blastocatellia bacterium]|nr:glycoside hydrolase family 44 protein [Blastocatellia bacterium]
MFFSNLKYSRLLLVVVIVAALIPVPFARAQNPAITISVDASAGRHPISPLVYGLAYATTAQLNELNVGLNRLGGNNTSRYNWQLNADNRGFDWYFESIAYSSSTPGEGGDTFISTTRAGGAEPMVTIPIIGWVAKLAANRGKLASFSIAKYGAQTGNDWQWFPDAGNGVKTSGGNVTGNDPNDASVLVDSTFQQGWAQHLVSRWGPASSGGLKYYILDNESSIWHSTHRDVHPQGATMEEIRNKILDYGAKIKAVDPSSMVVGPEEWGWSGYLLSGYDQQYGSQFGWSNLPDRNAHAGMDYLPWLLDQLRQANASSGQRLLDVFSVHYYPQGGEFSNDTSQAMQLRRNRSTRSLWDPNYVDETWINDKVQLIPRIKGWVSTYYPGTKTAVTEYNWGAESHINGATTQADILGIFGREGLDMAARWTTPDPSTPTYKAIKLYRNYDGNKSSFGDASISATVPNPDNLSAFASVRSSDGAMTVMVVNKYLSGSTPVTISLSNFSSAGTAQLWQLTSSNAITRLADQSFSGSSLTATLPPQSITLFVIPASSAPPNQPPTARIAATPASGVAPLTVSFDGSGSTDADGTVSSYAWSFGDGGTASGATASHVYSSAGSFTATLTVTDNVGSRSSTSAVINVSAPANQPPVARISASPTTGTSPLAVSFSGTGSSDPDGSISAYAWSFGDGTTASGSTTSHTYSSAGNFTATLTVTDNQGATSSTSVPITVSSAVVLNAPGTLVATASGTTVTLMWTDTSTGEGGFYIERTPKGLGQWARVGQVGANATTFSQTVARGSYSYRVQSFAAATGSVSAYSNKASVRVR